MRKSLNRRLSAGGFILIATCLFGQTFDVVSIKPNNSGARGTSMRLEPGGRFVAGNVPAMMLIRAALGGKNPNGLMPEFQIVGGPDWMRTDRFDIRAQGDAALSPAGLGAALLAMLEDRFRLKTHREMRELQVYALVIGKGGSKLKSVDSPPPQTAGQLAPSPRSPGRDGLVTPPAGAVWGGAGAIVGSAVPMTQLIYLLTSLLDRPVTDNTALTGFFDFRLQFAPDAVALTAGPNPGADTGAPSIFTALQEQLGLRLDSSRAPVEVTVIDNVQRPSEN